MLPLIHGTTTPVLYLPLVTLSSFIFLAELDLTIPTRISPKWQPSTRSPYHHTKHPIDHIITATHIQLIKKCSWKSPNAAILCSVRTCAYSPPRCECMHKAQQCMDLAKHSPGYTWPTDIFWWMRYWVHYICPSSAYQYTISESTRQSTYVLLTNPRLCTHKQKFTWTYWASPSTPMYVVICSPAGTMW